MARSDAQIAFVPLGAPLSMVSGAGTTIASNVLDILGEGVGVNPLTGNDIIGNVTTFGADLGVGGGNRPELFVSVGTAFTGAAGQLLKIALQAAPDLGVAGGNLPGAWTDIVSQDGITLANLTANAIPFRTPFLPVMPANLRPRYLRLLFSPMTATALPSGSFTAGTIAFALVTWARDDQSNKFAARNYTVA